MTFDTMMKNTCFSLCALVIASAVVPPSLADRPSSAGSPEAVFAQANQAYEQGDFSKARTLYESVVASGSYSADLFYNLGNTCVRLGDYGYALLEYQRALTIDPHHPEAALNAAYLRARLPEIPSKDTVLQRFFSHFSATEYACLLVSGLWVASAAAAFGLMVRWSSPIAAIAVLAGLTSVLAAAGFTVQRTRDPDAMSAMAVAPNARAHFAPAESSPTVAPVPPGTPLRILTTDENWLYVRLPDKRPGWMPANSVAPIIPRR